VFHRVVNRVIVLTFILLLTLAGSALAQDAEESETRYITTRLSLRDCPSLDCTAVQEYARGDRVMVVEQVTGQNVNGSDAWLRVEDPENGAQGYISLRNALRHDPDAWKELPVIPEVTDTAREIYQRGMETGNDPNRFSKVGDCQNVTAFFLTSFDYPLQHDLGEYDHLQGTIDHFSGSWEREGAAVRDGFNVASVLSPLWANPELCEVGENPLQCEYRLNNPGFVIISMETWWSGRPADEYERYLAQVVEYWIEQGVVPILGTKADNLEGDHSINASIAAVAQQYDIPLWNFWAAVQPLPNRGLEEDLFHLTYARSFFNDPAALRTGWATRNLTALQALDAVRQRVNAEDGEADS
jgi:hypothetical protein